MSIDTTTRTRRSFLAAIAGAVGASAAAMVATAAPVLAGVGPGDNGKPMEVAGQYPDVRGMTVLGNTANNSGVFAATSAGSGIAVYGSSQAGKGVYGESSSDIGVAGFSAAARAIMGQSNSGTGVEGQTVNGVALRGVANSTSGIALRVDGRIRAPQITGVAVIPPGQTSVLVSPFLPISGTSFVLLTPRVSLGGRDLWYTIDAANDTFTIRISSARTTQTPVGWLLIG